MCNFFYHWNHHLLINHIQNNIMKLFLSAVVKWLSGLKWSDFARVISAVEFASNFWIKHPQLTEEEEKKVNLSRLMYVKDWAAKNIPFLSGWKLNVIIELAVAYFNKTKK